MTVCVWMDVGAMEELCKDRGKKERKKKKKKQYGNGGVCLLYICEVKATRREITRSLRSIYYGVGGRGKEFSIMRDGEHKKRDQREGSLCMSCPSTQHRIHHPCVLSLFASAFLCVCVCVCMCRLLSYFCLLFICYPFFFSLFLCLRFPFRTL